LTKNCKRVCLANTLKDRLEEESTGYNNVYKSLGEWLRNLILSNSEWKAKFEKGYEKFLISEFMIEAMEEKQ
jgi:hypothetical protein